MLTAERIAALDAVRSGTVRYRRTKRHLESSKLNRPELTVAVGFLRKADLITVSEYGEITLTDRGAHVAARD